PVYTRFISPSTPLASSPLCYPQSQFASSLQSVGVQLLCELSPYYLSFPLQLPRRDQLINYGPDPTLHHHI
ncbi:hypothetical protein LINGRAHAP2_LOCUS9457, partial [Linum grandiflorum]